MIILHLSYHSYKAGNLLFGFTDLRMERNYTEGAELEEMHLKRLTVRERTLQGKK